MSANTNNLVGIGSFLKPIIHIDCDAFFTSVEQALHPELKGRPVVTGKERGIIACASYEAKALGISRGVSLWEAKKRCPGLVCLPSDYESYSLFSKRMFEIMRRFTPEVEEYSVDEAFAELSGLRRVHRMGYADIALKMKETLQRELGLTVSVGLSSSKTLAKIASKEKKPDGFVVVRVNELHEFLPKIALERVCGFGPNTVALLNKHGLKSVWDYVNQPLSWARKLLGKIGAELWSELRGEAVYPIVTALKNDYASISKCKTFTPPSKDRNFVFAQLTRNLESAFIKLRRHGLSARGLSIFLREQDFRSSGLEVRLDRSISSTLDAACAAQTLFDKIFEPARLYRLTGIVLFDLCAERNVQHSLFDDVPKIESFKRLDAVIDTANRKYGKHALSLGMSLWLGRHKQHLSERGDIPLRKKHLLLGETFRQRIGLPIWDIKLN
jgi:DNA polymerase-4